MANPDAPSYSSNSPSRLQTFKDAAGARLMSLDALRGFDMFWIVGAEDIVHALHKAAPSPLVNFLTAQLTHKDWQGVAFYDLIFPLFVFIVGVSLVFSLGKTMAEAGRAVAYRRVLARGLLLYLLGLFYYGGFTRGFEDIRLLGVLQRIALAYTGAGVLFCTFRWRGLVAACTGLLLGYWALLAWVPVRNITLERSNLTRLKTETGITNTVTLYHRTTNWVRGRYDDGLNVANHVDFQYLPWRKWDGAYDPEGLLSTLPAIATCLLGVFAGLLLKNRALEDREKVRWLALAGVAGAALGFLWGTQFPVIKKIWTSSYVLVAAGYACLMLAAFHQIIEVWNLRGWARPFIWIGVNPLAIYLLHNLVDLPKMANRLVGGPVKGACGDYAPVVETMAILALSFWFARFLYRRKVFLRL